jgi:SAM-dependent methyltransferase
VEVGRRLSPLASLRKALRSADYNAASVSAATSIGDGLRTTEARPVAILQTLRDRPGDPLALLVALLHVGATVARDELAPLNLDLDGLAGLDLLTIDGDEVTSKVKVQELGGAYVVSDRTNFVEDFVAQVSPSTQLAAAYTPRIDVDRALDVGTGSGAHALLAARRARTVVATDFNPRATRLTRLNADLNEVDNIETREGSFFEPVAGERFGLVVVNPPYVISPDSNFLYRDSGFEGDELSRTLLRQLPGHLEDGGFGALQCNLVHAADEAWHAPFGRALAGSGCDAIVLRVATEEPLVYAARWTEFDHADDPPAYRATLERWTASYAAAGIERITGAMVVVRKRGDRARNWRRAATLSSLPEGLGERLPKLFTDQDRVESEDLRAAALRPVDGIDVDRYQRPGEDARAALELKSAPSTYRPVKPFVADWVLAGCPPLDGADDALVAEAARLVKSGFVEFA